MILRKYFITTWWGFILNLILLTYAFTIRNPLEIILAIDFFVLIRINEEIRGYTYENVFNKELK